MIQVKRLCNDLSNEIMHVYWNCSKFFLTDSPNAFVNDIQLKAIEKH